MYILELMSRSILEQITAEELLNTRRFDPKILISCTRSRDLYRATIGGRVGTGSHIKMRVT